MESEERLLSGVETGYKLGLHRLQTAQIWQDWVKLAAREYLDRQSRRKHPEGHFDNAGRWYPSKDERRECCRLIRAPSRAYPYSLMLHCRTARHVARLCNVTRGELLAMAETLTP